MDGVRTVRKYTEKAIEESALVKREDYKAIKHMDRVQLSHYLQLVYKKGYDAGLMAAQRRTERPLAAHNSDAPAEE